MALESLSALRTAFETNPLKIDEAREAGRKVVGHYCLYSPMEMAVAAGAIAVSLCGTRQDAVPRAEEILPRTLCPLIKSSFGFALLDSCHYLAASDMVVADTTCDGKKKMYELLGRMKDLHLLQLPQNQDPETARPYWENQFALLREKMRTKFGVPLTDEDLSRAVKLMNRERRALKNLFDLSKPRRGNAPPQFSGGLNVSAGNGLDSHLTQNSRPPYTGLELMEISFKTGFLPNKEDAVNYLEALYEDGLKMIEAGLSPVPEGAMRLLLTGVPSGMGSHKVVKIAEELGAVVVVSDNCTSYKKTAVFMNEDAPPLKEMADRYLDLPCAVMSPNPGRYSRLRELAAEFKADGVIDLVWQGCQPFATEAYSVRKFVREELGLPYLMLETDYSESDVAPLTLRLEAFINGL